VTIPGERPTDTHTPPEERTTLRDGTEPWGWADSEKRRRAANLAEKDERR
jgi:hypothetical protein